ncbi:MAG: MFS transporter [Acidobacteria bacterium]|nr:MFS transporter [Acidobacteriota bacterium]
MATSPAVAPSALEVRTIRKARMRIIPLVFALFIIAALDRNNIGFAALTMNKELAIASHQYGFIAGIFFFGYCLFEIPSNLLMHRIGARVWIARILVSWGVVAALTGFAQSASHLYVARFLLGLAEAGYFPGIMLYLTYWFPQRQLAQTVALFLTANPVANILGAPVSGMILDHVRWFGVSSWRWLLVLEGVPAILGGIVTYFLLPERPMKVRFLSPEEKEWLTGELAREEQKKLENGPIPVMRALVHGRVWHLTSVYFGAMAGFYSMIFWMPQLLKNLSTQYSNTTVGLLVMIPYVAGLPAMIVVARSSDRRLERRYHAAIPLMIGATALLLLGISPWGSVARSVTLWCLVSAGIFSVYGPFWSLPSQFLAGFSAAVGIALINCLGNLGGFVGPYTIGILSKKTGSLQSGLVFVGLLLLASTVLILALRQRIASDTEPATIAQVSSAPTASLECGRRSLK